MDNVTAANITSLFLLKVHGLPRWTSYTFISCMILIALIGIPGNAIVLAVLQKLREKSSTDYFVFSMSIIDLYSATVNTVSYVLHYEPSIWKLLSSITFCRLHVFSIGFPNITTTLLLGATAYDRYRRTSSNTIKDSRTASTTAKRFSIGILVSGLSYSTFFIFTTSYESATQTCGREGNYMLIASVFSVIMGLVFISMFMVVIVCYTKVAIILHRHHKTMTKAEKYPTEENKTKKNTTTSNRRLSNHSDGNVFDVESSREFPIDFQSSEVVHSTERSVNDVKITNDDRIPSYSKNMVNIAEACEQSRYDSKMPQKQILASVDDAKEKRSRKMVNRTTLMMFFITLVYVSTWVLNWTASIYGLLTDSRSSSAVFLTQKIFMINCMTNPLFYIIMSSKFRQKAKKLLCFTFACE
ncbi:uncharacterized protein LOC132755785 [Ruditapes philippinarum]|uniref:uncharacterized protein LOC132755785 n=1 Tax=Ruditapes philippinarum TaxID=129788 RepID=UPI00295A8A92|nr:uncharacterized protein LOC132755785 [Ruditapes philippinarum]